MKIDIHLTINEEQLKDACQRLGCTREQIKQNIIANMEEDMGETISDNWDIFEEKIFEIE